MATGEVVKVKVVVTETDPEGVAYCVLGRGDREVVILGDKVGEWEPVTLWVRVAISLVAKGLKVTDMDGDIVGVIDGVAY